MAEIEMYATPTCDYCADARALFKKKGVTYKEIDVTGSKELRKEMTSAPMAATRFRKSSSTENISAATTTCVRWTKKACSIRCSARPHKRLHDRLFADERRQRNSGQHGPRTVSLL